MYQAISLILAAICLLKAGTALLRPAQFYGWRTGQYASTRVPTVVLIVPTLVVGLALTAWYATLFHYQAWGWIVTAFTTIIALLAIANLSRWSAHRETTRNAIETQPETRILVDVVILLLGVFFAALAVFVY